VAGANIYCMTRSSGYAAMRVSFGVSHFAGGLGDLFEVPAATAIVDFGGVGFGSIVRR
jgi:hypothetical protein